MKKQKTTSNLPQSLGLGLSWSTILNVFILVVALYVLLPQVDRFQSSKLAIREADFVLMSGILLAVFATCVFAAYTYIVLSRKNLRFANTFGVQVAGLFANRLLPAGLGGLGLNIRYLIRSKHTYAEATSVAAANNLAGFIAYFGLLIVALSQIKKPMGLGLEFTVSGRSFVVLILIVSCIGFAAWIMKKTRRRILNLLRESVSHLLDYQKRPASILLAIVYQLAVSLLYGLCFYLSLQVVGLYLPPAESFIVFSLGAAAAAVTPTPGGLVGVEAGLLTGLIGYGLPEASALSAVLLYRLLTYWLPIIPGIIVFKILQWKRVI